MKTSRQKTFIVFLLLTLFSLAGCGTADMNNNNQNDGNPPSIEEPNGDIDQAGAEEIALADANLMRADVSSINTRLDESNGIEFYEVKFVYSSKEYEYKIDVKTGEIIESENED
jgi:uncharacterized membrane protein YkoI